MRATPRVRSSSARRVPRLDGCRERRAPTRVDAYSVRVISLSDGRICYLDCVESTQHLPPESRVAVVVEFRGRARFPVELPNSWEGMQEAELRRRIELALHACDAPSTPAAAPAPAPVAADTRGFLARLFGLWPHATGA